MDKKAILLVVAVIISTIILLVNITLVNNMIITKIDAKLIHNKTITGSNKQYVNDLLLNQTAVINTDPWTIVTKVPSGLLYRTASGCVFVPDTK